MSARATLLPDGRLHLQHGPIDLVIQAWGDDVGGAYEAARATFVNVLPALVCELPLLRRPLPSTDQSSAPLPRAVRGGGQGWGWPVGDAMAREFCHGPPTPTLTSPAHSAGEGPEELSPGGHGFAGPVARRMAEACWPYRAGFITPMAAVAGAVADHVLAAMLAAARLDRAYVNNGGDIAFHVTPGHALTCGVVADMTRPAVDARATFTADGAVRGIATSGRACKGRGGRSFSLGIADAVTVLARDAAAADAAATIVANAVDLPGHKAITRVPAASIDPDSDLGDHLVTWDLGWLAPAEIDAALAAGRAKAQALSRAGLIAGAYLALRGRVATTENERLAA